MYSTTSSLILEKNKREGSHPIYLYAIAITDQAVMYYTSNNADVNFYIPGTATPQVYTAAPITHDKVESNTQGEIGTVQLTVQNVNRYMMSLLLNNDALRGCKVTILLVFSGSLGDFDNYLLDEYFIDSSTVTETAAVFNLKSKFVVDKVALPKRKYRRDQCAWSFKGVECGYDGGGYTQEMRSIRIALTAWIGQFTVLLPTNSEVTTAPYQSSMEIRIKRWADNTRATTVTATYVCTTVSYQEGVYYYQPGIIVNFTPAIWYAKDTDWAIFYPDATVVATSVCMKTFSYCATLHNQHRFGNFPGIPTRNIYF